MKRTKHLLALLITFAMVLTMTISMGATSFAASDGKITIDNAVNGEKYNLYKVFDLTYSGEGESNAQGTTNPDATEPEDSDTPVAYSYTASGDSDAFLAALQGSTSPFDVKAVPGSPLKYSVTRKTSASADDIISFIEANVSKLPADRHVKTDTVATGGQIVWDGLDYGYYYVTSTAGSFVTIDSAMKEVTVKEKNSIPSQDKKQATGTAAPTSAAGYTDDEQQVQVGDKVWYQIEVTDGKGTDKAITVTDTLTTGLTNDENVKVYVSKDGAAEQEVTKGDSTWTLSGDESDSGFKVTFAASYVNGLTEKDKLYIRFSATVNTNAASNPPEAGKETNTSKLDYSNQSSTDSVDVKTYKFQLDKTDKAIKPLLGAKFELYRGSVADANKIKFSQGTAEGDVPVLIVDPAGTITEIDLTQSANVIIKGLDKDSYVLRETKAPEGYNPADDTTVPTDVLVEIKGTITDVTDTTTGDVGVETIINHTGAELPSTGGIGTVIFYVLGSLLVIGCGVVLISRKRIQNK